MASTARPNRHPRLQPTLRPSWPHCLSTFSLYSLVTPQPSALTDLTALVASFGLYGSSCLTAFGFGQPYGPRDLAACHPSASTAPAARQPKASTKPSILVASLLVSIPPIQNSCIDVFGSDRLQGPLWFCCLSAFSLYCLASPTRSPLTDLVRPIRTQLIGSLQLRPTLRPSWPHCFSALCLYGQSYSAALSFDRAFNLCGLAACHYPAYME